MHDDERHTAQEKGSPYEFPAEKRPAEFVAEVKRAFSLAGFLDWKDTGLLPDIEFPAIPRKWFDDVGDGWVYQEGVELGDCVRDTYEAARRQQDDPDSGLAWCLCHALPAMASCDPAVAVVFEALSGAFTASDGQLVLVDRVVLESLLDDATAEIASQAWPRLSTKDPSNGEPKCGFASYAGLRREFVVGAVTAARAFEQETRVEAVFYARKRSHRGTLEMPRYEPDNLALARVVCGGADRHGELTVVVQLWSDRHQAVVQCLVRLHRSLARHLTTPTTRRLERMRENMETFMAGDPRPSRPYQIVVRSMGNHQNANPVVDDVRDRGFLVYGKRRSYKNGATTPGDLARETKLRRLCQQIFGRNLSPIEDEASDLVHYLMDSWRVDVHNDLEIEWPEAARKFRLALDDGRSARPLEDFHPEVRALLPFQDPDVGKSIVIVGYNGDNNDTVAKFKFEIRQLLHTLGSWGLLNGDWFSEFEEDAEEVDSDSDGPSSS
mmetsp:Transcript_16685/g.54324  ORF Transcript_16685/g.54324 Transcript_16685/m.54324 type:complete len:495 (+) Transcript_16685:68-1552(+)